MKNTFLHIATLFLLLLVTGVFWGTWFPLTRSINEFSPAEFIHIGKVIISNVAWPMRLLMPATILAMTISVWLISDRKSTPFYAGVTALALLVVTLMITLVVLVPIDNDIKEWTTSSLPTNWEEVQQRWSNFHTLRTLTCLGSFVFYSAAILVYRNTINRR